MTEQTLADVAVLSRTWPALEQDETRALRMGKLPYMALFFVMLAGIFVVVTEFWTTVARDGIEAFFNEMAGWMCLTTLVVIIWASVEWLTLQAPSIEVRAPSSIVRPGEAMTFAWRWVDRAQHLRFVRGMRCELLGIGTRSVKVREPNGTRSRERQDRILYRVPLETVPGATLAEGGMFRGTLPEGTPDSGKMGSYDLRWELLCMTLLPLKLKATDSFNVVVLART